MRLWLQLCRPRFFEAMFIRNLSVSGPELADPSRRFRSLIDWNGRLDATATRQSCIFCLAVGSRSRLSFISQSLDRVQPRSASGWKQSETESDQNGYKEAKQNGERWNMDVDGRSE